ncbi:hypothetical protein GF312_02040 [Candidatus Poribacteria bacterium]|nr:hypothetical protein [Candidatus Poribacteria bacterium]
MLPKDRVLATFKFKAIDKIPIHNIGFSSSIASIILGREAYVGGGIQQWREACALWQGETAHEKFLDRSEKDAFDLSVILEHDILRLQYWRMPVKPTKRLDKYTFLYGDPDKNWRIMKFDPATELYQITQQYPPKKEEDINNIEKYIENLESSMEKQVPDAKPHPETKRLIDKYGDRWIVRIGGGSLGIPYSSPVWLEAIVSNPSLVTRYLNAQTRRAILNLESLAEAGVKIIFGGGDFAAEHGPFYSPKAFHELMLPCLKIITDECHKLGIYYLFASDGNLWPVAEDLFKHSGVDGYYEIDSKAGMDIRMLRERFPKLVLIGNISSYTLHKGNRKDVIREATICLEEARRSGGIIVGVSNYIMPGTPEKNLWTLIDTIKNNRKI